MRADENNLRASTANFRLDVVTRSSVQIVCVTPWVQPSAGERILDEIGSGIQLRVAPHISLADFAAKGSHAGDQFVTEPNFIGRERRRS